MLKQALSVLTIMTAGAGLALGQDAINAASRLPTPSYGASNAYDLPAMPSVRSSPYGNYQTTTLTADGSTAIATPPSTGTGCAACGQSAAQCCMHGWFDVDYLMMFPSRMSVPVVLNTAAGAPLAGNSPDLGISHGVRFNTGLWLHDGQLAVQGIIFGNFRSEVINTQPAGTIPVNTGVAVTNFTYDSWHQLAGAEVNGLYRLIDNSATKVYFIGGGRYVNLEEDLTMRYSIGTLNFIDDFHSRNQFGGPQIGAMLTHRAGPFDMDVTAKVALGVNYAQLYVLGLNTSTGAGANNVQAFTQASNIGTYSSSFFAVIPELNANLRYRMTEHLSLNVGYDFMMSTNNWRAGNQVTTTFPPVIAPPIRSTYYINGFTAGFSVNY
jgi:hypothetical protein